MEQVQYPQSKWENALEAIPHAAEPYLSGNQIFNRQRKPRLPRLLLYPMLEDMADRQEIDRVSVGHMKYYRSRNAEVELDAGGSPGYNHSQRNRFSLDADVDYLYQTVHPLARGKTVMLWMELPATAQKKTSRISKRRLVVLSPGHATGLPRDTLLVSVIGSGSTLLRPLQKEGVANLVLAGMPARLAHVLMNVVRRIFKE